MPGRPPVPVCKVLLACQEIFLDARTQKLMLLGLTRHCSGPVFPVIGSLSIFARLTSGHGAYQVTVQLQGHEDNVLWSQVLTNFSMPDPLQTYDLRLHDLRIVFPSPGKHHLVLLLNGQEVARDDLYVHLATQQAIPPGSE